MADVTAPASKELRVVDSDMDGAAEAIAFQALGEFGRVVLVGVAGELFHGYARYDWDMKPKVLENNQSVRLMIWRIQVPDL